MGEVINKYFPHSVQKFHIQFIQNKDESGKYNIINLLRDTLKYRGTKILNIDY